MDANRLVRQHKDVVYTLCLQVLRHRQDAEDACQEALLKIARRLPPDVEPDAWIHRVALRTAIDHRRARMRRRTREEKSARPESVGEEAAPALLEALEALPDEDRTLLVERFFARRTLRAMADARGVSEPAVWKRVEKGKEKLRQALLATAPALVATMDGALEAVVPARAPAHVLPAASAKSAILLAALALPAVVAAGLAARTPSEPDPAPSSGSRPPAAAAPAPKPDPAAAAAPT
ncbi:MAG TPA: sigma-70 family RNA polymerase sigma factor, partial [Planctomycetota bacterium]|nr:sigma-70 family RNA polymerase sigma factor [Planctomycetota bacterium]